MRKLNASGGTLTLILMLLWGTTFFLIEGCGRISLNYLPDPASKISGSVSVSDFKYIPAEEGKVKPYQIRNAAFGSLKFDKPIDLFFRNAVFAQLNSAGIKLDDKNHELSGKIEDFFIDELSTSADWTLRVNYSVKNQQTGKKSYEAIKITKRSVSKLADISAIVNDMVKLNIEELLKDEDFLRTIK